MASLISLFPVWYYTLFSVFLQKITIFLLIVILITLFLSLLQNFIIFIMVTLLYICTIGFLTSISYMLFNLSAAIIVFCQNVSRGVILYKAIFILLQNQNFYGLVAMHLQYLLSNNYLINSFLYIFIVTFVSISEISLSWLKWMIVFSLSSCF